MRRGGREKNKIAYIQYFAKMDNFTNIAIFIAFDGTYIWYIYVTTLRALPKIIAGKSYITHLLNAKCN